MAQHPTSTAFSSHLIVSTNFFFTTCPIHLTSTTCCCKYPWMDYNNTCSEEGVKRDQHTKDTICTKCLSKKIRQNASGHLFCLCPPFIIRDWRGIMLFLNHLSKWLSLSDKDPLFLMGKRTVQCC